jgi:hypothetical protein
MKVLMSSFFACIFNIGEILELGSAKVTIIQRGENVESDKIGILDEFVPK